MFLSLLFIVIVAVVIYYSPLVTIRLLSRIPFKWTYTPANTFVIIVTREDNSGDGMKGSGNVVDTFHAIPGKYLDKSSHNQMDWELKDGIEPENQGFLFEKLGVQNMGDVFYTTRLNTDKRMRFARESVPEKPGETRIVVTEELHTITKVNQTRNVFYSGELTVSIKEADTSDRLGVDFEIDFSFERQFPVRSVLRLADSAAFVTSLVENIVNDMTVSYPAEAFIGGSNTQVNRRELIKTITENAEFNESILSETGIKIRKVSLRDVSMTKVHRDLLELKTNAEKQKEAAIIKADETKAVEDRNTDWMSRRLREVTLPAAQNELVATIRVAELRKESITALAENGTITHLTLVDGKDAVPVIPLTQT